MRKETFACLLDHQRGLQALQEEVEQLRTAPPAAKSSTAARKKLKDALHTIIQPLMSSSQPHTAAARRASAAMASPAVVETLG